MLKSRIYLIHGWSGSPEGDWFPWAINVLTSLNYEVIAPLMPDTDTPIIDAWVGHLSTLVGDIRESDIFIGHSIGCQTILRFLENSSRVAAKIILVAPWFTLTNLGSDEMWDIADPWLKTPLDFSKIINKAKKFITIFSDNDAWVPYKENESLFRQKLNPEIIVLHNKGHITAEEGSVELKELIDLV
jgi:predicted alpha/beta hydrolase family esterase